MTMSGSRRVAPARPFSLTAGFAGAMLYAVLSLLGAVLLIAQAKNLAKDMTAGLLGEDSALLGNSLIQDAIDQAANTLTVRGVMAAVAAVAVAGIALLARNGGIGARISLAVLLLVGIGIVAIAVRDVVPTVSKALDLAAILVGVVTIVFLFFPANGRYAKERKIATA